MRTKRTVSPLSGFPARVQVISIMMGICAGACVPPGTPAMDYAVTNLCDRAIEFRLLAPGSDLAGPWVVVDPGATGVAEDLERPDLIGKEMELREGPGDAINRVDLDRVGRVADDGALITIAGRDCPA